MLENMKPTGQKCACGKEIYKWGDDPAPEKCPDCGMKAADDKYKKSVIRHFEYQAMIRGEGEVLKERNQGKREENIESYKDHQFKDKDLL